MNGGNVSTSVPEDLEILESDLMLVSRDGSHNET
jgi:hypothetical protein